MFNWAYEIPNWQVGAILSCGSVVLMWVGIIFIRPFFRLLFARQADLNAVVGNTVSAFSVSMAFCSA